MTCPDFEAVVVDLARGQRVEAAALAHAERCGRCGGRLAGERELSARLRLLAGAALEEAPERVEEALREEFRRRAAEAGGAPRWRLPRWAMAAAAAAVVIAGALAVLERRPVSEPPGEQEIATEFIPLVYEAGPVPGESWHVVRVKLPRTALASFGLPLSEARAGEPVKADVVLGEDGVARAIRFVSSY